MFLLLFFWASTSAAAAQSPTGDIQGTVVSASGSVLAGVTVTITNTATGLARETLTDTSGVFAAPGLPVGPYEVEASLQGFATRRQPDLLLQVGQPITVRLELRDARAPETITIAGTAPMLEPRRSQVSSAITSAEVEHLPVRGRNALNLAALAPGVFMFDRVVWDGHERSHPVASPSWISQEATHGLQVSTNSYMAEYGRATAGIISLVTKSGSNQLDGSVFGLRGNGVNQFGGAAGGPLARNRHFAYGIYDGVREKAYEQRLLLAKTDHALSDAHRLSLRFSSDSPEFGRGSASAIEGSANAFSAAAMSAFGSTLVNEARVLLGRDRYTGAPFSDASVTRFQFADTLTWLRGAHKLKAGVDAQRDRPYVSEYAVFVQDEWRVDEELTANFGIRFDAQTFAQSDSNNFGPRLGLAWAPAGTSFIVRGGYGIVYGHTPWAIAAVANALDVNYENPRVHQASTGFEWEWMPHSVLAVSYLMARGDRLPRANAGVYDSTGRSQYHGVAVDLTRRFAQGHQYRLSYTLGTIDDAMPDAFEAARRQRLMVSVIVSSNRIADRFSGLLESVVKDWTLSAIYTAQKGARPPAWISLDPRIARDIGLKRGTRVTVFWQAFNLLGRPNSAVASDMLFGLAGTQFLVDPLFGPALGQPDARAMQLAVRFSF